MLEIGPIASQVYSYGRSYLLHERLILDVWCSDPRKIVIYTEAVIDEPHDYQVRTFLLDDQSLCTQSANWLKQEFSSWEAFLADPTSCLMEAMI